MQPWKPWGLSCESSGSGVLGGTEGQRLEHGLVPSGHPAVGGWGGDRGGPRPWVRPHSPGRPPRCRGTGARSEASGLGPRVQLLWASTSSRRALPPLVTAGTGSLRRGRGGPGSATLVASAGQCPRPRRLQSQGRGPAHLPAGATARHTGPWRASRRWRMRLLRRLPAAAPGVGVAVSRALQARGCPLAAAPASLPASPAPAPVGRGAPGGGPGGRGGLWLSGAAPPAAGSHCAWRPPGCLQGGAVSSREAAPGPFPAPGRGPRPAPPGPSQEWARQTHLE